jgi:hypothetical protein
MTIPFATRTLLPLAMLALLTACERPTGPPPPKAETAATAGQAGPSTVALSGTILEPQPSPAKARPSTSATSAAASVAAAGDRPAPMAGDNQALRDFQAEQARRDRELLDQDLSEAQLRAREDVWDREREPYVLPREDGDWSPSDRLPPDELPPEDFPPDDELPIDEPPFDEPPYDDEPEPDDGYDPRDGAYRP